MVMQVVTEELDVGDRRIRDIGLRKVAREQNEGDVANIFGVVQPLKVPDF